MKKLRFQPTFASLTEAELEQLAADVQRETYDAVRERVCKPRSEDGLDLHFTSNSPLVRLHNKKNRLDLINAQITSGQKLTLAQLDTITAGHSGPCGEHRASEKVHDAIMSATYILVTEHDNTPHQLLALQRLADFPARAEYREQSAQIRAERLEIARSKENRAKEMHTHKIAMDLRKQTHKEKSAAFKQDLALARLNPTLNPNLFSPDEDFFGENRSNGGTSRARSAELSSVLASGSPTSTSRDAITNNDAAPADPYLNSETPSASESELDSPTKNSKLKIQNSNTAASSFLSPAVLANTNLYDQKIDAGEIRVIYAPGKHYEIEYCNPADQPALERLHKSAPLRFFEDPTRTHYLPGLRTFGKNPYIPPSTAPASVTTQSPIPAEPLNSTPAAPTETLNAQLSTLNIPQDETNSTPQTFPSKTDL